MILCTFWVDILCYLCIIFVVYLLFVYTMKKTLTKKEIRIDQDKKHVSLYNLSPKSATLLAGIAIAISSCCCDNTPRSPEDSRKGYEKAKKERCKYDEKEGKILRKIEELKIDLVEIRAKEEGARAREEILLNQAKEQSNNFKEQDCPTCD